MRLSDNGIDVFYIDESHDQMSYVITAVCIPFLRKVDGVWSITWPDHLAAAESWRSAINKHEKIPRSKELHGNKLISGRGNFFKGKFNFDRAKASGVYRRILSNLDWVIPDGSVITAVARRGGKQLFGRTRLEAALYAVLQRMRTQCSVRSVNALVFFDQGHDEYRKLYRQAQAYLPTGSKQGGWAEGTTKNLSLDMFIKDGNEKNSKFCFFTQIADLIAYAAFLKVKDAHGELEKWQADYKLGALYDQIPQKVINLRATNVEPRDGIVRLY